MFNLISTVFVLSFALSLKAQTVKPIYVVHVNLGNAQLSENIEQELLRTHSKFQNRPVIVLRPNLDTENNPFAVSRMGFQTGIKDPPLLTEAMLSWYEDLEKKQITPEVFIINGHHTVGLGFNSDNRWKTGKLNNQGKEIELPQRSLYFETLIASKQKYPIVKRFFDQIKLVFIGGCEGLTNLEPKEFGLHGRVLTSEEIVNKYLSENKDLIIGDLKKGTGLAGYRYDLHNIYGLTYTASPNYEICLDAEKKLNCERHHVYRFLSDVGLWDGSHKYNRAYQLKRFFPGAYAVFGFFTPSPRNPGPIWKATFDEARRKTKLDNILQTVLSEKTQTKERKEFVQTLRISWTKMTQKMNQQMRNGQLTNRISGSITPAFPELDTNGLFAYEENERDFSEGPSFAPYEEREKNKDNQKEE